jgi:para-nitrobenzyl esterase
LKNAFSEEHHPMKGETMKRNMLPSVAIIVAGLVFAKAALAASPCTEPVMTEAGLVRGMPDEDTATCVWKGIPYAAAPVEELRWASPQPHPGWEDVRDATEFGPRCMQKGIMEVTNIAGEGGMSEDCLYLNIWKPEKSGTFPVMVWVHGGGYYGGSGSTYDGGNLAEAGEVVVVTINYRLNIFGFFAHPALRAEDANESTGSQGTLDQVAAIRWVHDNIAEFSGDPDNITIFGESAGGWSICTLVATPLSRGLFHRAILESGGCDTSQDLEDGYRFARSKAEKLGCPPDDIDCLRQIPAKKVLKKGSGGMLTTGIEFMPHHDDYVLSGTPLSMIRSGQFNQVHFMAGFNRDEFAKALKLLPNLYYTRAAKYRKKLTKRFGLTEQDAQKLVELYPLSEYKNRPVEAYGRMLGADAALACPTFLGLAAASGHHPRTYLYRYDYDGLQYGKYMGAFHGAEIAFVFGNTESSFGFKLITEDKMDEVRELSRIMQGYWVNFAKTGDPNGPGLPEWQPFDPDTQMMQVLDTNMRAEPAGMKEKCAFWEEYSRKYEKAIDSAVDELIP